MDCLGQSLEGRIVVIQIRNSVEDCISLVFKQDAISWFYLLWVISHKECLNKMMENVAQ